MKSSCSFLKNKHPTSDKVTKALEGLNQLLTNLMLSTEKGCRKLWTGHYEFSPVIKGWLDRCHAYRQIIQLNMGKNVSNITNIKQFAERCGIHKPLQYSPTEPISLYKKYREKASNACWLNPLDEESIH